MRLTLPATCLTSLFLAILAVPVPSVAFETESHHEFNVESPTDTLKIISTADVELFTPIALSFQQTNTSTQVAYTTVSSAQLMQAIYQEDASFDLAISSAMDLQTKLANDGFVQSYRSTQTERLPAWGKWRDQIFAFTVEPASIVISPRVVRDGRVPTTRQQLIDLLRSDKSQFARKVGTYDVRSSGLGYLFATQDARNSDVYWRLAEVLGGLGVKLYCCSGDMITAVENEEILIAYNALGSYAQARKQNGANIIVIQPEDFTTYMLRTAVIPKTAVNARAAGRMIDHLLTATWAVGNNPDFPFPKLSEHTTDNDGTFKPIRLGPGLLVFLDAIKRRHFLKAWEAAIIQH